MNHIIFLFSVYNFFQNVKFAKFNTHEIFPLYVMANLFNFSYTDFLEVHMSFENTLLMRDRESNRICGVTVYSVIPTDLKNKSKNIWILRVNTLLLLIEYICDIFYCENCICLGLICISHKQ